MLAEMRAVQMPGRHLPLRRVLGCRVLVRLVEKGSRRRRRGTGELARDGSRARRSRRAVSPAPGATPVVDAALLADARQVFLELDGFELDLGLDELLDVPTRRWSAVRHEAHCQAFGAGTAGAADAVDVVLGVVGDVEVETAGTSLMSRPRAQRRGDEEVPSPALEGFKRFEPLSLAHCRRAARGLDIKGRAGGVQLRHPLQRRGLHSTASARTGRAGAEGLAVSFVSHSDQRLVGDIEKLIKTRSSSNPSSSRKTCRASASRAASNDGRRAWGGDDPRDVIDEPRKIHPREFTRPRRRRATRFFDKPYETPAAENAPQWEVSAKASCTARHFGPTSRPARRLPRCSKTTA